MLKSDMNDSYPCPDKQLRVQAHGKQLELTESSSCFRNKIQHVLLCCGLLSFMLSNFMCLECLEAAVLFKGIRSQMKKKSTVPETVLQLILIYLDWSAVCDSMGARSATASIFALARL